MATVKFIVKPEKVDKQGFTLIQIQFQDHGKRVAFSTGEKIKPKSWDATRRRVKTGVAGATELNAKLDKIEQDLRSILRTAEVQEIPITPEYVREAFDRKRRNLSGPTLLDRFNQFCDEAGRDKAEATINIYRNTRNQLKEFGDAKRYRLAFDALDVRFYDAFTRYLQTEHVPKLSANTVGKTIKTLKTFLGWAVKRGFSTNQTFRDEFKVSRRDADFEHLTAEELGTLLAFDFSEAPYLDRCRDVFAFACLTGLRFSDLQNLRWENVKSDRLEIHVQKTRESLTVPLPSDARAILDKYAAEERPLPVVSNQKANQYLKQVCERAGLTQPVQLVKYNGGTRLVVTKPKYELITTHTARRTFVINALESGVRAEVVMSITGHATLKAFQRYVRITDKVKFLAMDDMAAKRGERMAKVIKIAG